MKKKYFAFLFFFVLLSVCPIKAAKLQIDFIHPLCWFTDMEESEFQILIHGAGVADFDVELSEAQSVKIKEVVKVQNPNYVILYLDTKGAQPQTFNIVFSKKGKQKHIVPYQLKAKNKRVIKSYSSADVLYLLMPDRFANGNTDNDVVKGMRETICDSNIPLARHGGDIQGMTNHLDYLANLGITAIWPTPVLENNMEMESYHGYAITDYYHVDPRLGTNDDYCRFVEEAHQRGLKVVMDMVFNHCGAYNPIYMDMPQSDWFNFGGNYVQSAYRTGSVEDVHASAYDRQRTTDGWFVKAMPDWNQRNSLVRDYLIQNSIWWIETAQIDGIRQDTYPYNDYEAMVRWCERIEQEYPGFNIVGEAWINNNVGVSVWQKDSKLASPKNTKLKTVMDFPLMALLNHVCDEETDEWNNGFAKLYEYISQDGVYADTDNLLTFLDNHDTNRFQYNDEIALDTTRYKLALTLLLTLRGTPQLYYGNEVGMAANKGNGDGALRQNFPGGWPNDQNDAFSEEGRNNRQNWYFNFTRNLLLWRKNAEAVHHGTLIHFHVRNGIYVFSRKYNGKIVTVVTNGTNETRSIPIEPYQEVLPKNNAVDVLTRDNVHWSDSLSVSPKNIVVLDFNS